MLVISPSCRLYGGYGVPSWMCVFDLKNLGPTNLDLYEICVNWGLCMYVKQKCSWDDLRYSLLVYTDAIWYNECAVQVFMCYRKTLQYIRNCAQDEMTCGGLLE